MGTSRFANYARLFKRCNSSTGSGCFICDILKRPQPGDWYEQVQHIAGLCSLLRILVWAAGISSRKRSTYKDQSPLDHQLVAALAPA
jgi:hypothetical protein